MNLLEYQLSRPIATALDVVGYGRIGTDLARSQQGNKVVGLDLFSAAAYVSSSSGKASDLCKKVVQLVHTQAYDFRCSESELIGRLPHPQRIVQPFLTVLSLVSQTL